MVVGSVLSTWEFVWVVIELDCRSFRAVAREILFCVGRALSFRSQLLSGKRGPQGLPSGSTSVQRPSSELCFLVASPSGFTGVTLQSRRGCRVELGVGGAAESVCLGRRNSFGCANAQRCCINRYGERCSGQVRLSGFGSEVDLFAVLCSRRLVVPAAALPAGCRGRKICARSLNDTLSFVSLPRLGRASSTMRRGLECVAGVVAKSQNKLLLARPACGLYHGL